MSIKLLLPEFPLSPGLNKFPNKSPTLFKSKLSKLISSANSLAISPILLFPIKSFSKKVFSCLFSVFLLSSNGFFCPFKLFNISTNSGSFFSSLSKHNSFL